VILAISMTTLALLLPPTKVSQEHHRCLAGDEPVCTLSD
jgi:hypothetical protein